MISMAQAPNVPKLLIAVTEPERKREVDRECKYVTTD